MSCGELDHRVVRGVWQAYNQVHHQVHPKLMLWFAWEILCEVSVPTFVPPVGQIGVFGRCMEIPARSY